jgi:hypothetical protein
MVLISFPHFEHFIGLLPQKNLQIKPVFGKSDAGLHPALN